MRASAFAFHLLAASLWLSVPTPATAASPLMSIDQFRRAVVAEEAPVFLRPDARLTPLRRLPAGTVLTIGQAQGEWVQVTFNDLQLGRRTGWIESRFVRIELTPEEAPSEPAPPPRREAARPRPAATAGRLGIRAFGTAAFDRMASDKSFEALFGKKDVPSYGGGIQVTNLWRGIFAEVSAERSSLDGERAFVSGDAVFPLGIPLKVTMTPLDVVAGWRSAPAGRIVTYGGAGFTSMAYTETSDFADTGENVDERYKGWVVLGGVEVRAAAWVHVRGEVRYRQVPNVLGSGGVSAAYDETKLGGVGVALKVAFGR